MEKTEFIRCPVCGNKTRDKIREDTVPFCATKKAVQPAAFLIWA